MRSRLDSQRGARCRLVATALLLSTGCATTKVRSVDIPSADNDASPSVVVRVRPFQPTWDPGAPTGIEFSTPASPAGADTTTLVSNVDTGTHVQVSANATNGGRTGTTGGVRTLTLTIQRGDSVLLQGVSDAARDQNGQAPNSLAFRYSSWTPKRPIHVTVDTVPIVIIATAINFHGNSNTLRVTYVPIDHANARSR